VLETQKVLSASETSSFAVATADAVMRHTSGAELSLILRDLGAVWSTYMNRPAPPTLTASPTADRRTNYQEPQPPQNEEPPQP